jgi:hypothetical protein
MYSLLFALVLFIYVWVLVHREGLDTATTSTTSTTSTASGCDTVNAQNEADLFELDKKIASALELTEKVKKMEIALQQNTTQIDSIINTQLTALINGKR